MKATRIEAPGIVAEILFAPMAFNLLKRFRKKIGADRYCLQFQIYFYLFLPPERMQTLIRQWLYTLFSPGFPGLFYSASAKLPERDTSASSSLIVFADG